MSLDAYTDQQLMDELLNRRLERENEQPIEYCEDCQHFKVWTKPIRRSWNDIRRVVGDVPDDYNPCSRGHSMLFRMPEEWEGPHADCGYYRRACCDRKPIPPPDPPKPKPAPEPARGTPGWKPRTI
ncbi:hypothetical protein [Azotobacter chroococcum]|uniref:hypothetical protein n=1 Tax=Azotobacter chroococcum TaxID=353 RepID=UPI0010ADCFF8|nr:hypothetical protein [Azotobacter chroococcum]TKD30031.1 hypothetical protein FCG41_24455 [Azotobacter chroococcum]